MYDQHTLTDTGIRFKTVGKSHFLPGGIDQVITPSLTSDFIVIVRHWFAIGQHFMPYFVFIQPRQIGSQRISLVE